MRLLLVVMLGIVAGTTEPNLEKSVAGKLVRAFIFENYGDYKRGNLSLRHLKEYVVERYGSKITYAMLRMDVNSAILEDEVDAIHKRCDGGKKKKACIHKVDEACEDDASCGAEEGEAEDPEDLEDLEDLDISEL
eukprot:GEMP01056246.1.p1 GENE.GEMP01056246.1~~GEMP01056246.1.p1  ORF type:complete len:135 (+),score=31.42 GEMP01056246.1:191-595(+)